MPFEKGNDLGGRTHGAKNKVPQEIKENVQEVIQALTNSLVSNLSDLENLSTKDKLKALEGLLSYILPKHKSIEVNETTDRENLVIRFE